MTYQERAVVTLCPHTDTACVGTSCFVIVEGRWHSIENHEPKNHKDQEVESDIVLGSTDGVSAKLCSEAPTQGQGFHVVVDTMMSGKLASVGLCASLLAFFAWNGVRDGDHDALLAGVAAKVTPLVNVASLGSTLL